MQLLTAPRVPTGDVGRFPNDLRRSDVLSDETKRVEGRGAVNGEAKSEFESARHRNAQTVLDGGSIPTREQGDVVIAGPEGISFSPRNFSLRGVALSAVYTIHLTL